MAKARAIVKRRKAVRNIRKITKTMQMIATAKFQKSLKRAVGTKPYSNKDPRAGRGSGPEHRGCRPSAASAARRNGRQRRLSPCSSSPAIAGWPEHTTAAFCETPLISSPSSSGRKEDRVYYVVGKKGISYFNFQHRPITQRYDASAITPKFAEVETIADQFIDEVHEGAIRRGVRGVHELHQRRLQKPDVITLLPLAGVDAARRQEAGGSASSGRWRFTISFPMPQTLLDELLPLTVKTALFQAFLDATTSEHVARMIAMKSATDNADKMVKSLTMKYNRARQSQITTELSEIMGGVEAMKG